ncbi:MAG: S1/P1 nuclease [Verrucomicrobiales bacterium]|jgi:hypothetical protein|nr:S1/P1 nuclease [Verrucomicrobiales bacterium]
MNHFARLFVTASLVQFIFPPLTAKAWDAIGHMLVTNVAAEHLTPLARQKADALAQQIDFPGRSYDFITLACWMDDIRTKREDVPFHGQFTNWHYIDMGVANDDPPAEFTAKDLGNPKEGNVVQALNRAVAVLRGGTDPLIKSPAMALAMIEHLVGDIHQPLHCASYYFPDPSSKEKSTDQGGNLVIITNSIKEPAPGQKPRNYPTHYVLHYFWDAAYKARFKDSNVVIDPPKDYDSPHLLDDVKPYLFGINDYLPASPVAQQADFAAWAMETNKLAREKIYGTLPFDPTHKNTSLSAEYVHSSQELARQQIVLAGLRLANLLNQLLDPEHAAPVTSAQPNS